jgi:transposase
LTRVVTTMMVVGAVDADVFFEFVRAFLLPELQRGDIVVLDNVSFHKVAKVAALFEAAGIRVLYQPPYSPEFNPIELLWAKLKDRLRALAPRTIKRLEADVGTVLREITAKNCEAWFRHCGYVPQAS